MDWDKLRIFHAAAEAGSFTHAGEALRMSQSAVSRQVSALEKELKVALFHRHARGLVLTEQGEMLFGTASEIMNKLLHRRDAAHRHHDQAVRRSARHGAHRARHGLGDAAPARVPGALSRHPRRAGAQRRADRDRHARRRRRHLDQRAAAERPDPAPAVHDEDPRLRVGPVHPPLRRAADARGRSTSTRSSPTAARRPRTCRPSAGSRRPASTARRRASRHSPPTASSP